jgi:gamma-glutamyltranspeptidase/glutathione hydrolase
MKRAIFLLLLVTGYAIGQEVRPLPVRSKTALSQGWNASGERGAVVAGGALAVDAGLAVLREGGNAIDAAVATILAQGVTDADQFCLGGEVPILVYDAKRQVVEVVAGMGEAPQLATREHFAGKPGIPARGLQPAAVPAALDALLTALERYGTRTFSVVVAPALKILDRHEQPWHADLAATLRRLEAAESPSADRRRGLRLAADCFYRGPIAREIDAWSRAQGGLLRYADLAAHVTRVEEPAAVTYRGHTVFKCGPWTQGPALLQALQLLEGFDIAALKPSQPDTIHVAVEALKLAFADRDVYYADPLFADVPLAALLSPHYAEARRTLINMRYASLTLRPGDPRSCSPLGKSNTPALVAESLAHDTTTCLAADRWGNVVAATPSGWSGVLAGRTGIWLGSRLQSFNTWEGHPNVIEPGKRPRITLTPTLVLKGGRPACAVSVAGGDLQDQVTLQMLLDVIDFGLAPSDAVVAPRFATNHLINSFRQTPPKLGSLVLYEQLGESTSEDLRQRGHQVSVVKTPLAAPTVIRLRESRIDAAGDPRTGRHAGAL